MTLALAQRFARFQCLIARLEQFVGNHIESRYQLSQFIPIFQHQFAIHESRDHALRTVFQVLDDAPHRQVKRDEQI